MARRKIWRAKDCPDSVRNSRNPIRTTLNQGVNKPKVIRNKKKDQKPQFDDT